MMEWDNFTEDDAEKLKRKVEELIAFATVPEEIISPEMEERSSLKYGRIYLSNFVQSIEVISLSTF